MYFCRDVISTPRAGFALKQPRLIEDDALQHAGYHWQPAHVYVTHHIDRSS